MKDADYDSAEEAEEAPRTTRRPAWVSERPDRGAPGRRRAERTPLSGRQEDDGLWLHAAEIGGLVVVAALLAVVCIPRSVPLWEISTAVFALACVTWWTALNHSSVAVASYLAVCGLYLTAWISFARVAGLWHGKVIYALVLPALVLIPAGVTVIRRHRDRARRAGELGRDNANVRECLHWDGLLHMFGVRGVEIRDVIKEDGGYQVHCRLGRYTSGEKPTGIEGIRELAGPIAQHKRLPRGAVYIEEEFGGSSADFVIHVRSVTGPRLTRWLPAENSLLSVNSKFPLGVHDTGREFRLLLREIVVFICGVIGSGKSTLLNIFIAQLCRMPDALIFMIDLKGGQEARMWLMPWIMGLTDRPAIDWVATTRQEADVMLDAVQRAGGARAESGRHARKLRPSPAHPAVIVICDEQAVLTGHAIREDGLSNNKLAIKLLRIAETYRSVAITPVVAAVRAVVDVTGKSGIKAMASARIGMRVNTADEGRTIFPDDPAAARQLALLKDRGMGIPKIGAELHQPVHFYNISDGEPDDDGHPTEDRITPIVLATTGRRPKPEQLIIDAMNEVRVTVTEGGREREAGAYEARWQGEHIRQLFEQWRQAADEMPPPPAAAPRRHGGTSDFDDIIAADPALSELSELAAAAGWDSDERLHPARKEMRKLLIACGPVGYRTGELQLLLKAKGLEAARETIQRWLAADEKKGYVFRTGKPRSKWIWRLRAGDEFDLPGMDM